MIASVHTITAILKDRGLAPGDRVLLLGGNTIPYVLAFWGILEAGVVVLGNGWWSRRRSRTR